MQLDGLVRAAALAIKKGIPTLAPERDRMALDWARRTAEMIYRARGPRFVPAREIAAKALQMVFRDSTARISNQEALAITGAAWAGFAAAPKLLPGVTLEWLREIRRLCAGMGVITDGDSDTTAEILDRAGLQRAFDSITVSEQVRAYKPDRRIFEAALRSLHANPHRTLFVSDSPRDLIGASRLGIAVGIVPGSMLSGRGAVPKGTLLVDRREVLGPILQGFVTSGRFAMPLALGARRTPTRNH